MPPRIVREGVDEPRIEGSQVTVRQVTDQVHDEGLSPETVADRHGLDIAAVYYALAYYHDNLDEMDGVKQQPDATETARERSEATPPGEDTATPQNQDAADGEQSNVPLLDGLLISFSIISVVPVFIGTVVENLGVLSLGLSLMALPLMIWPYRMARIGERWEGIGSKREWNEIEPTDWKVTYTRISGAFILLMALTLLAIWTGIGF